MKKLRNELKSEMESEEMNLTNVIKIAYAIYKKVGIWGLTSIAIEIVGLLMFFFPEWFNLTWPWFAIIAGILCGMGFILILTFGIIFFITDYKLKLAQSKETKKE
jgi:hypothetical protein